MIHLLSFHYLPYVLITVRLSISFIFSHTLAISSIGRGIEDVRQSKVEYNSTPSPILRLEVLSTYSAPAGCGSDQAFWIRHGTAGKVGID